MTVVSCLLLLALSSPLLSASSTQAHIIAVEGRDIFVSLPCSLLCLSDGTMSLTTLRFLYKQHPSNNVIDRLTQAHSIVRQQNRIPYRNDIPLTHSLTHQCHRSTVDIYCLLLYLCSFQLTEMASVNAVVSVDVNASESEVEEESKDISHHIIMTERPTVTCRQHTHLFITTINHVLIFTVSSRFLYLDVTY
jgi:hypothetical protein